MVSLLYKLNCFLSDYSKGFGGKFGIQTDRVDKSAVGFDHLEKVPKHESQRGWSVWPAWVLCLLACCLSLQRTYFKPPPHKNLSVQCCKTFVPLDTCWWNFYLQIRSVKIEFPSFTIKHQHIQYVKMIISLQTCFSCKRTPRLQSITCI